MGEVTVGQFPSASTLTGSELIPLQQNGILSNVTAANLLSELSVPILNSLTVTQASYNLSCTLSNQIIAFRNPSLASGLPVQSNIVSLPTLTIPYTSTLGMIATGVSNRIIWLVAYNAGTPVLCVVNLAGGNNLDETTLISPTTIGASSDRADVIYSASLVAANSPFRVIGFCDVIFTTSVGWSSPTLVQPCGGQALAALSSLGYGQTWKSVTRTTNFNYYNATGRPILSFRTIVCGVGTAYTSININGTGAAFLAGGTNGSGTQVLGGSAVEISPGESYVYTDAGTAFSSQTTWERS